MENIDVYNDSFESIDSCEKVILNLTEYDQNKVYCKYHTRNELILICLQNQWHCQELCVDCVQIHNEQHINENKIVKIQNIDQVQQECQNKIDQYAEQYQDIQNDIKQKKKQLRDNYDDQFIKELESIRSDVIDKIN